RRASFPWNTACSFVTWWKSLPKASDAALRWRSVWPGSKACFWKERGFAHEMSGDGGCGGHRLAPVPTAAASRAPRGGRGCIHSLLRAEHQGSQSANSAEAALVLLSCLRSADPLSRHAAGRCGCHLSFGSHAWLAEKLDRVRSVHDL